MSNGRQAVRLQRRFEADIDRVFRAFTDLELIHQRLPAGADPHQYRQAEAALASLTRHIGKERTYDADR